MPKELKHRLRLEDFPDHLKQLNKLADPELLVLKLHMLIERLLVATLAIRLREENQERVPRMSFATLIDLAVRKGEDREPFVRLNELRNALAHEFDALNSTGFARLMRAFRLPWPSGAEQRRVAMHALATHLLLVAEKLYVEEFEEQLRIERPAELPDSALPILESATAVRQAIETHDQFLEKLRKRTPTV